MIDIITVETAHLLGDALPQMHRLRYRIFVEAQGYNVPALRGMEWDQFDTPATTYMLWRDANNAVRAVARLIPCDQPYMIKELWPDLLAGAPVPTEGHTWEVSRVAIDPDLPVGQRLRIMGEMLCALGEFALASGIKDYLFVTYPNLVKTMMRAVADSVEVLGDVHDLGGHRVVPARVTVTWESLHKMRRSHGIAGQVTYFPGHALRAAA